MKALDHSAARPARQTVHAKPRPVVSRANESGWFAAIPGETVRVRVPSAAVGGGFAIVESVVEPGFGPPLHFHREDEIFEIVEGIMTFQVGEERVNAGPGTIVTVPAGMHHAWFNFGKVPVRLLVTFAPGGVETLFAQLRGLSMEEMGRLAASYGTVIVGGPLTE